MKHCPDCTNEFTDEAAATSCPDCGTALRPGPNPRLENGFEDGTSTAVDLIELAVVPFQLEADVLRSALEDAGIATSQRPSAYHLQTHMPPASTTTQIRVMVRREDEETAREILQQVATTSVVCSDCGRSVDEGDTECPWCGAELD